MRTAVSRAYWLLGFAGNIHWALSTGPGLVLAAGSASYAFIQQAPPLLIAVLFAGVFLTVVGLINHGANWYVKRALTQHSSPSAAVTIGHVQGDVHVHQPPTPSTKPESEPLPPRYLRDETIRLIDFWHENAEIESGQKVIRHWMFQSCRILGPAVLLVREPNKPTNFIECEWEQGEKAFSVKHPKEYSRNVEIVSLFHTKFVGCRFTRVEMSVSQETYERYKRGEHSL